MHRHGHRSAEGEAEELDARVEELNLDDALGNRSRLTDQLVGPLLSDGTSAVGIDVRSMRAGCWLAIYVHPEGIVVPRSAGPITRFTSRAWKRMASRAFGAVAVAARREIDQGSAGAH